MNVREHLLTDKSVVLVQPFLFVGLQPFRNDGRKVYRTKS